MRRIVLLLVLVAPIVSTFAAEDIHPGELVTLQVAVEEEQSYVVVLPKAYDPSRRWPVLYCMDARYRGELVAKVFQEAAENHGWILACSNNTASDGPVEPNIVAMRYLWYDTHSRFSIDDRRVYATGFSGLSRFLWHLPAMKVPLAGAIGVGGGTPWRALPEFEIPFVFYGVVGTEDFNWSEMHSLDSGLEERGVPHRLTQFEGPHSWPDPETAERAVRWMDLRAVRAGTAKAPRHAIESWLAADIERLRLLNERKQFAEAGDLADWIRRDYEGLVEEIELPEIDPKRVRQAREARDHLVTEELAWVSMIQRPVAVLLQPGMTRGEQFRARKQLDIEGWKKKAEGDDQTIAHSANRRLATVFGQLSFYLPNSFIERGEIERAMTSLDLAAEIDPDSARLNYQRARLLVMQGRHDQAVEELETLIEKIGQPGSVLADDENFESLAKNRRFLKLIGAEPEE